MEDDTKQDLADSKSAKKFMWLLMLIPIGLAVGVVASNINFRKREADKFNLDQYRVSQVLNEESFQDDMEKVFASRGKRGDYYLQHISSTLGINNYLTKIPTLSGEGNLGYYDIKGDDEGRLTVVVVELNELNQVALSSLIAIPTAVIQSVAGEKNFGHTLRFVFLPMGYDGDERDLRRKKEKLDSVTIIRAGGDFTVNDALSWREDGAVLQHPALAYPHKSVSDQITSGQVELSMQAARQLRERLLEVMRD